MRRLAPLLALVLALSCAGSAAAAEVSARIVGPNATDLSEAQAQADWPFIALVYPGGSYLCGGSVVTPRWVLTAAHCGYDKLGNRLTRFPVYPGAYDQRALAHGYTADASLVNPSYAWGDDPWDFMLLRLPAATSAPSITLPTSADEGAIEDAQTAGSAGALNARIAGWGLTTCTPVGIAPNQECSDADQPSDVLRTVSTGIPLLASSACASPVYAVFSASTMVCAGNAPAGDPTARNDTCGGDSGGPLTSVINGRRVLVGATSFGYLCGKPGYPGVYARVTAALPWICDTVTSPTAISATAGSSSATVTWSPDTTTCPGRDATVQVTASPGGATATAKVSSGTATLSGLSAGATYAVSARVVSAAGATPPAATTTVSLAPPPPEPPAPPPCIQTFFQQAPRTYSTATAPDGTAALKVLSRIRVYQDAESWCRTDLTFIFRNKKTGARVSQLPGSTLGFRRLTGKDFSAPVVSWPTTREFRFEGSDPTGLGRKDARLMLQSYLPKGRGTPAMSNVELMIVRRIPADTRQAPGGTNALFAQKNVFGAAAGWAVVS